MKKMLRSVLSALMVCSMFSSLPVAKSEVVKAENNGTIYYVSSKDGNDNNDGLSEASPFKTLDKINELTLGPSDQVLLESGSVFNDQYLHIQGSGAENEPIIISKYGEGADPIINTNGKGIWYQDYGKSLDNAGHKYKGDVSSSILLYDVEYIEISELEITNSGADPNGLAYNDVNVMNRTGIAAVAQNAGTLDHIVIKDCNVHDVIGNVYDKHMNNGGIYFTAFKPDSELLTGIPRYNDVVIENNIVDYCNRWGIAVGYTAYYDKFYGSLIDDEKCATYGHTNVVIRNNYVNEPGGDAITMMYCFEPLVEYNVGEGTARQINTTDYSQTGFGRVAAGIWPWKCKTPVFQYNECYDSYENQDGQAWDADYGDGCIYQYNYSHNNGGGCMMICGGEAINTIFRYNISYLDGNDILDLAGNPNGFIYNNTFIVSEGANVLGFTGGKDHEIYNNIFYYTGATAKNENWFNGNTQADYERNLYYNYATTPNNDDSAIIEDPKFVDLDSAPTAYNQVKPSEGQITYGNASGKFDGFKVANDSAVINAGLYIENNGGLDFFGNEVSGTPDIGAYESNVADFGIYSSVYSINTDSMQIENVPSGISKEKFLENLDYNKGLEVTFSIEGDTIDTDQSVVFDYDGTSVEYSIKLRAASSENAIVASDFAFDEDTIYVPIINGSSITVAELMDAITVSENAQITTTASNNDVVSEDVVFTVIAENGAEKTYAVEAKNEYSYLEDYEVNTQGPIWFAQVKSGTVYSNLTEYDTTYPQFNGESYAGVGVDAQSHAEAVNAQHGLMIDAVDASKRSGGHAIAFKASVDGKVTISLKDGEPYLRQAANQANEGTVVLKFTKNGELVDDAYTFPNDGSAISALEGYAKEIVVSKGDYVRVEIQNVDGACLKASAHVSPIITYTAVEKIVDKSELEALYEANKDFEASKYTDDSYYIYNMILNEALLTLQNEDATQADVDLAKSRLQAALDQLERYLDPELLINTEDNTAVKVVDKSSECTPSMEPNGKGTADATLDKDESSYWHSNWGSAATMGANHYLTYDLGEVYEISDVSFLPRQGSRNGDILSADLYISEDNTFEASEKVGTYTFANDGQRYTAATLKVMSLNEAVSGRYVKVAVTSCGGDAKDQYASMAEIYFYQKGEEMPEVDKTALQTLFEEAMKVDSDLYTEASMEEFIYAYNNASKVLHNENATQEAVDAAVKALTDAINALEEKPVIPQPDPKPTMDFYDVQDEKAWFYGSVEKAFTKGLMLATGKAPVDGKPWFEPDTNISRGMVATVLYRMAGQPKVEFKATFSDVTNGSLWYSTAITWAAQNGVVSGYKDGRFGPDDNITRQDLAIMLRNYAKAAGLDTNVTVDIAAFKDGKQVVDYAQSAVAWCVEAKLMSGSQKGDGTYLMPTANATRAECAKMFSLLDDAIKANTK